VCLVDGGGRVTHKYGGKGSSSGQALNEPGHVAVDENSQFIFVADWGNHRIVVLSPKLEFVRYIQAGLHAPLRLHLHLDHADNRVRLHVSQSGKGKELFVIKL